MLQRLRLSDVKATVAAVLNYTTDDTRLITEINDAQQRLLEKVPIYFRYRVNTSSACISWPRELETIERVAICGRPRPTRDIWYEFLDGGPGVLASTDGSGETLVDDEEAPAANDVLGENKKLALYADSAEDVDAELTLRFYSAGEKRLQSDGQEGEVVTLVAAPAYAMTTAVCDEYGLYAVIKPVTAGRVRLYEYDTTTLEYRLLSIYEPDEEIPVYRRSKIPGLCADADNTKQVDVIGLPRFRPARNDSDFLFVNSAHAIRLACQAMAKEVSNLPQEAMIYWNLAVQACTERVNYQRGRGAARTVSFVGTDTFGAGIQDLR